MSIKPQICLGIDLGTTNSSIAVFYEPNTSIQPLSTIQNVYNSNMTPSVIAFTDSDEKPYIFGKEAIGQKAYPDKLESVFYQVKKLIGRDFLDPHFRDCKRTFTFNVTQGPNNKILLTVKNGKLKDQQIDPIEISALVLKELSKLAARTSSHDAITNKAVITVPANFNDRQRKATAAAAKLAGLEPVDIISEPIASCIKYAYEHSHMKDLQHVLVYDFGGGTLDVSLVKIENSKISVISTAGDNQFGGSDIDNYLFRMINNKIIEKYNINLERPTKKSREAEDPKITHARMILLSRCEEGKIFLSSPGAYTYQINEEFKIKETTIQCKTEITRTLIEQYLQSPEISKKLNDPIDFVLNYAKITKDKISKVLLVGGSSNIPYICTMIKEKFNLPGQVSETLNKETAICEGAAIYGAFKVNKKLKYNDFTNFSIIDVTPLYIGIGVCEANSSQIQFESLIKRNSQIPCKSEWRRYLANYFKDEKKYKLTIPIMESELEKTAMSTTVEEFSIEFIPEDPTKDQPPLPVYIRILVDQNGINLLVKQTSSDPSPDDFTSDHKFNISNSKCDYSSEQWTIMDNRHKNLTKEKEDNSNVLEILTKALNSLKNQRAKIFSKVTGADKQQFQKNLQNIVNAAINNAKANYTNSTMPPQEAINVLNNVEDQIRRFFPSYVRPKQIDISPIEALL